MNKNLYPLRFTPIIKDKIWGGSKLKNILKKPTTSDKAGESWEISAVEGDVSVVADGFLAGNELSELVEVYMGDLVGHKVYEKYGNEFPLLFKFIDANDDLSIQVHPNDEVAARRHHAYGKTEMWYIMQADSESELVLGFKEDTHKETYTKHLNDGTLMRLLNKEVVTAGEVIFLPAGRVHAIGKGILLAEIQETSDLTYRIFDYNRPGEDGKMRELHTDLALDVIDFKNRAPYKTEYTAIENQGNLAVSCPHFTTNVLPLTKPIQRELVQIDSFVVYMCVKGGIEIIANGQPYGLVKGQSILIPAEIEQLELKPSQASVLLEVYIDELSK